MEHNVRRLTVYKVARDALFWLPVFFLYFSSRASLAEVLWLEAIYYAAVVVLEVPSGYFSDRVGRRAALRVAAGSTLAAYVTFGLADSLALLVLGQLLFAIGMAFNSGTDSALLYDSLAQCGRENTFEEEMSRLVSRGFWATAAAALIGGLVGGFDLRWAYVLSAAAAVVSLAAALSLHEPTASSEAAPPGQQLRLAWQKLKVGPVRWVFAFVVLMTVFNHVPYELVQPYTALVLERHGVDVAMTPWMTGIVACLTLVIAALASRRAATWERRRGRARVLLAMMALQGLVIAVMGVVVHGVVVGLLLLRSVPSGVATPLVDAAQHRHLDGGLRATFLSLQSLAGRFAFSVSLFAVSALVGAAEVLDVVSLQRISLSYVGLVVVGLAGLWAARRGAKVPLRGSVFPAYRDVSLAALRATGRPWYPPGMTDTPVEDTPPARDDAQATNYDDIEAEVNKHFEGKWENFFKAVSNPAEIMHFILHSKCGGTAESFEAWAKEKDLPTDWLGRFFSTLTEDGALKD